LDFASIAAVLPGWAWRWVGAAGAVVVSGVLLYLVGRVLLHIARRAGASPVAVRSIREGVRIIWVAISALAVVTAAQLTSYLTVLTISGVVGLAFSLALQAMLSNMVSGILLLRDRALTIGDTIACGGVKGRVVRIALRNTWVVTAEGDVAIIGNSTLAAGPLVNYTARARHANEFGL
jgi:small-conductance mechanosensitive channel